MASTKATSTRRPSLSSMRKTALVAGILYLLTFISSIPAVFLLGPVLTDPNFIIGGAAPTPRSASAPSSTSSMASPPSAPRWRCTAVIKRQHEGFAIGFVGSRLFEGAILL